jgi:hypothetical protein
LFNLNFNHTFNQTYINTKSTLIKNIFYNTIFFKSQLKKKIYERRSIPKRNRGGWMRACRGKRRRNGHGGIRYWCSSNAKNAANLPEPSQKCQDKVSLLVGCLALLPSFPLNSKLVQKKISLQWFDMNQHLCLAKMRKKERFSVFFFSSLYLVVLLFYTWFIYHYFLFFYFKYLSL